MDIKRNFADNDDQSDTRSFQILTRLSAEMAKTAIAGKNCHACFIIDLDAYMSINPWKHIQQIDKCIRNTSRYDIMLSSWSESSFNEENHKTPYYRPLWFFHKSPGIQSFETSPSGEFGKRTVRLIERIRQSEQIAKEYRYWVIVTLVHTIV